jgi:exopolysaccharide production protein ExoZ
MGLASGGFMRQATGRVETINSIQILRALAATSVVVYHIAVDLERFAVASPGALSDLGGGGAGVDLFFVISGFVMVYASEPLFGSLRGAVTFFILRLVRIVPFYWLVTAFYLAVALLAPRWGGTIYPIKAVIASFLFMPFPAPDGIVHPVVGQGWTLNYEMYFYAVFAIAVLAPRRGAVVMACALLVCGAALNRLLGPLLPFPVSYWTDPVVLEFAMGMLLGLAYREGARLEWPFCVALILSGAALFAINVSLGTTPRFFMWGVPAALVVAGATFGRFSLQNPLCRPLAVVGDASYALYLLHTFPLRALLPLATWLSLHAIYWLWLYVPLAILVPVLLAIVVHYAFERPITKALRRYASSWIGYRSRSIKPDAMQETDGLAESKASRLVGSR